MNRPWSSSSPTSSLKSGNGGGGGSSFMGRSIESREGAGGDQFSFLDDMLGPAGISSGGGSNGMRNLGVHHNHHHYNGSRPPTGLIATHQDANDIDDILDLVSTTKRESDHHQPQHQQQHSNTVNRVQPDHHLSYANNKSNSNGNFLMLPGEPLAPPNNHSATSNSTGGVSSAGGAGAGVFGKRRFANSAADMNGGIARGAGAAGVIIEDNRKKTSSPFFNNHHHQLHDYHVDDAVDDVAPIPFFGITSHDDDDTISQITTSVASQSYGDSRGSGSYPWLRQNSSNPPNRNTTHAPQHHQLGLPPTASAGAGGGGGAGPAENHSYADTLDEIADMLHPTQPLVRRTTSSSGVGSDYFRSKSPGEDLFRTTSSSKFHHGNPRHHSSVTNDDFVFGASSHESHSNSNNHAAPALTPNEIYRKSKTTGTASTASSSASSKVRSYRQLPLYEPFVSHIRLQLRYLSSLVVPRKWREAHKKRAERRQETEGDDDIEGGRGGGGGGETDYFSKIVRNSSNSNLTPNLHHKAKKPTKRAGGKATGRKQQHTQRRRQKFMSSMATLLAGFCVIVFVLVLYRFGGANHSYHHYYYHSMSIPAIFGSGDNHNYYDTTKDNNNNKHYTKRHSAPVAISSSKLSSSTKSMSTASIQDAHSVRGGMASRDENPNVRGGMAQHTHSAVTDPQGPHAQHRRQQQQDLLPQDFQHHHHLGMDLPPIFDSFADVINLPVGRRRQQQHAHSSNQRTGDIPFFWHIPRTGGGTVNDLFAGCMQLTLASDAGGAGTVGQEHRLDIVTISKHYHYVNVDTSTPDGIARAKRLRLTESGMADVVVSTLLHQAATLFSPNLQGRMFTMFRHPVERAVSLFHYVQDTQWRRGQTFQQELADLSIDEYFKSGLAENNWMTRFLTNELTKGELTKEDLHLAKEILRRKCLIGLLKEKGESFARFEKYFGFPLKDDSQKDCHEKKLQWAWPLKHRHDEVDEGSPLWDLIMSQNMLDMELYDYAQILFREQSKLFQ